MEGAWGRTDGEASEEPAPPTVSLRFLWKETSGSAELSGSVSLDGRKDCRFGRALLIAKKLFLGAVRNARHWRCQIHHIDMLPTIYRNYTATGSHRAASISLNQAPKARAFGSGSGLPRCKPEP